MLQSVCTHTWAASVCDRLTRLAESIITGINAIGNGDIGPVVDGTFLPDFPSHLITSGRFSVVEYMGGHCTHDGKENPLLSLISANIVDVVSGRTFAGGKPSQFVTDEDIVALTFPRWPYVVC